MTSYSFAFSLACLFQLGCIECCALAHNFLGSRVHRNQQKAKWEKNQSSWLLIGACLHGFLWLINDSEHTDNKQFIEKKKNNFYCIAIPFQVFFCEFSRTSVRARLLMCEIWPEGSQIWMLQLVPCSLHHHQHILKACSVELAINGWSYCYHWNLIGFQRLYK